MESLGKSLFPKKKASRITKTNTTAFGEVKHGLPRSESLRLTAKKSTPAKMCNLHSRNGEDSTVGGGSSVSTVKV